jgi:hypothetical protein
MRQRLRSHLTYANVVSTLCLFLLLGGTAVAVDGSLAGQNTVGSADIINGEVKSDDLATNAVGTAKINDRSVKNADLGPGASASNTIADGGVKGIDIANGQVTGADVGNESLSEDEIADIVSSGGVTQVELGAEKVLLQDGPFTVTATCYQDPSDPGQDTSYIIITSSEEHSVADMTNWGNGEIPPSGAGLIAMRQYEHWAGSHFFAAAPSGATLEGHLGAGIETLGYDDCTATVTAIGTSALD